MTASAVDCVVAATVRPVKAVSAELTTCETVGASFALSSVGGDDGEVVSARLAIVRSTPELLFCKPALRVGHVRIDPRMRL